MRRYAMVPDVRDGMVLPNPVFEITLKDDANGDPLIMPCAVTALGIVDSRIMDELWTRNQAVMQAIHAMFAARKLDLWDIKIEWGLDENGRPLLIDEISPGSCRAYKAGTRGRVQGLALAKLFG
jgi:phosphoribosylaminoimidazole-succinocarboxamide synthase